MNSTAETTRASQRAPSWASPLRRKVETLLDQADIRVNGDRPWDMKLNAPGVMERIVTRGSLGLGEAYMNGEWDAEQLDVFFEKLLRSQAPRHVKPLNLLLPILRDRLLNRQSVRRAWDVGEVHYDLGNDFFEAMLDHRMTYSCGYWKQAKTLDQAQEAKLDLVCRKLQLEPGMRVLDIGCGWGSFMGFAAERYGARCVGITVSREQAAYARERYQELPVEIRVQDYRELDEPFDRIASIGMFEHVGHKNHRAFMQVAHRCLADNGLFLLHTIGRNDRRYAPDPWIDKYIFPGGDIPAAGQIGEAVDGLFVIEDLHNFGADYDTTLMAWHHNFERAWSRFAARLGECFHRQWRYYLLSCAGAFRARQLQTWQWTLSKEGVPGGCPRVD